MSMTNIAPTKTRLAHEILDSSYAMLKLVRSGETDINLSFLQMAKKFITEIEMEIERGKAKVPVAHTRKSR